MTDVDDPVRRLLEQIKGRPSDVLSPLIAHVHAITPDVARMWLALPEQLQQARDAMRWRKASRELPDGQYAFAFAGHDGAEIVTIEGGSVIYAGRCGWDAIDELPEQSRFLGPLPEVPRCPERGKRGGQ